MHEDQKESGSVEVIVETPRGSRYKYNYDEKEKQLRLKKILPAGHSFPFDFGFIPGTKGEDGDALDILIMADEPLFPGCMIECRIIGAIKARQTERDGSVMQNHRLIGVAVLSQLYKEVGELKDLNPNLISQVEQFFISYNQQSGKNFKPEGRAGAKEAHAMMIAARKV